MDGLGWIFFQMDAGSTTNYSLMSYHPWKAQPKMLQLDASKMNYTFLLGPAIICIFFVRCKLSVFGRVPLSYHILSTPMLEETSYFPENEHICRFFQISMLTKNNLMGLRKPSKEWVNIALEIIDSIGFKWNFHFQMEVLFIGKVRLAMKYSAFGFNLQFDAQQTFDWKKGYHSRIRIKV